MKKKIITEAQVRVIRASWDGSLDYLISVWRARQLYHEGKISWDCTNNTYTTHTSLEKKPGEKIV